MKIPAITLLLFWLAPVVVNAQKFTPKWYGRAETKTTSAYNSYLCEMVIHKNGNQVTGMLNYFFGQQEHLVKISGIYWPQTKTIELHPFKLISHFAKDQNSPDCQVDGSLTLYTDGGDSVLYGQINPVGKYRNMCPILTISLNKEIIPEPGNDPDLPVPDGSGHKPGFEALSDSLQNTAVIPSLKVQTAGTSSDKTASFHQVAIKEKTVSQPELIKRTFIEGPLIQSDADTIFLHLYDNGQVDNDTVSVFFNRLPVVVRQKLSVTPIIVKLTLQSGENEIAMFAENLGDIPPNTALCLIFAGDKRYDINLVSNLATNGTVRITRKKNVP